MKPRKHVSYIYHLGAYLWAAKYVYDKSVVEIGSGEGYGAQILSLFAKQIQGFDASPTFTRRAQANKYHCHANFTQADFDKGNHTFEGAEAVVAFEILEHLKNPSEVIFHIPSDVPLLFSVPHNYPHPLHTHDFNSWADVHKMLARGGFLNTQMFWMKDGLVYDHEIPFEGDKCRYVGIATK